MQTVGTNVLGVGSGLGTYHPPGSRIPISPAHGFVPSFQTISLRRGSYSVSRHQSDQLQAPDSKRGHACVARHDLACPVRADVQLRRVHRRHRQCLPAGLQGRRFRAGHHPAGRVPGAQRIVAFPRGLSLTPADGQNEADIHEPDYQVSFWGQENYDKVSRGLSCEHFAVVDSKPRTARADQGQVRPRQPSRVLDVHRMERHSGNYESSLRLLPVVLTLKSQYLLAVGVQRELHELERVLRSRRVASSL